MVFEVKELDDMVKKISKEMAEKKEAFILEQGKIILNDNLITQKLNLRLREIKEARHSDFVDINNKIQKFKLKEEQKIHGEFYYGILFTVETITKILEEVLLNDK